MTHLQLRELLLSQADTAFLILVKQIDDLLDSALFYFERYPEVTSSDRIKCKNLASAVKDLGALPQAIAAEMELWRKGENRVLSAAGVEEQLLNELYATIEATMLFFIREGIDFKYFSLSETKLALRELIRCNRLL